jgi:hypothetical protein
LVIYEILNRNGIAPAPVRFGSIGWRWLMKHYREQVLACDFFTIDTFWLKTLYVIYTPLRASDANAYAEQWVRMVREDCLDHLLIMNQTHLKRVLDSDITYYESSRSHQGLNQQMPVPRQSMPHSGQVRKRTVLGGIINDYYCAPYNLSHRLN